MIIEEQQNILLEALVYLLEKTRPDDSLAIARILGSFTKLKTMKHISNEAITRFFQNYPDLKMPQLTFEMMEEEYQEAWENTRRKIAGTNK